jgi:hypothetical protein
MLLKLHAFISGGKLVDMAQWTPINPPLHPGAGDAKFGFCDVTKILNFGIHILL